MVNYQCYRCFHSFQGPPGPNECPNCGFIYVRNIDAAIIYKDTEAKEGEAVEKSSPSVEAGQSDDPFVDCNNDSCIG